MSSNHSDVGLYNYNYNYKGNTMAFFNFLKKAIYVVTIVLTVMTNIVRAYEAAQAATAA